MTGAAGVLQAPTKVSFLAVEIHRSAERDSFTVHACWCSTTLFCSYTSGVLEKRVSRTRCRTKWAKSSALFFPYLSPYSFYLWERLESLVYAAEEE
jgi:hypothetical protein